MPIPENTFSQTTFKEAKEYCEANFLGKRKKNFEANCLLQALHNEN